MVVIEAAERGGALITALRAAEYGVPVFAVPGDIDRQASRGYPLSYEGLNLERVRLSLLLPSLASLPPAAEIYIKRT